ncbi:NUDIX domain-containing protein [Curtobacterium sp. MCLR17_007]|uniref:NUDIX domain-containing protein n=1 Tax=Curtobacterium sp. MCLR17_007 TaxID=2175648 RepID=UPI000DA8478E|nr:NUDIX domain-containing protein [Curtobacterium sp. MCLR17_007]WIB61860.1 NUDIX domain-containing protein [Curtobacterium sp. MCLR17_007]
MRVRAAAVVIRNGHLLLIDRRNGGRHYCVLPGGGVEDGEDLRTACRRELLEETSLEGTVGELLDVPVERDTPVAYFVVSVDDDVVTLGGPECKRASATNRYEPIWVPLGDLAQTPLVPDGARYAVELALDLAFERDR